MRYVVDCSIALKWVVVEPGSEAALLLLQHELHAPDFILAECANALWKYVRRGEMTAADVAFKLEALKRVQPRPVPLLPTISRALDLACLLNHPVYDCLYLAAAEAVAARLVTADTRLLRVVADTAFAALAITLEDATAN